MSYVAVTGLVTMRDGRQLTAESNLEFEWLLALDFHPHVERVEVQPFRILYDHAGKQRRYTPDKLVWWSDGHRRWTEVHEVKYRSDLRKIWSEHRLRFKAAYQQCRASDHRFKIITERHVKTELLKNAKFFARYRDKEWVPHPIYDQALIEALHASGASSPHDLLAAVTTDLQSRLEALPALWRLIAVRAIGADLTSKFDMRSPIWMPTP